MSAVVVRNDQQRSVEATGLTMADFMELINPQTMTCTLLCNGEVVDKYKVERCDNCAMITKLDDFGYQKKAGEEKILWFCGGCR